MVFSGGSSVGERDLILDVIARRGEILFHGIAVKPGKPTAFGLIDGKPVFGMPGYPTSCLSNAYMLLVPALRRMAHLPPYRMRTIEAPARTADRVDDRADTSSTRCGSSTGRRSRRSKPPATSRRCRRPTATSRSRRRPTSSKRARSSRSSSSENASEREQALDGRRPIARRRRTTAGSTVPADMMPSDPRRLHRFDRCQLRGHLAATCRARVSRLARAAREPKKLPRAAVAPVPLYQRSSTLASDRRWSAASMPSRGRGCRRTSPNMSSRFICANVPASSAWAQTTAERKERVDA